MKKRIIAMLLAAMLLIGTVSASAAADLFYYPQDAEFQQRVAGKEKLLRSYVCKSIELYHPEMDDSIAADKITFDLSKMYALYKWDADKMVAFMNAADPAAYLKTLEIMEFLIPTYYDGTRVFDCAASFAPDKAMKDGIMPDTAGTNFWMQTLYDKDAILSDLKEIGVEGYDLLMTGDANGVLIGMAEKAGVHYYILLPLNERNLQSEDSPLSITKRALPALYDKRALTEDEFQKFMSMYAEAGEQIAQAAENKASDEVGGTLSAADETDGTDELNKFQNPVLWWVIGGIAVVAAAAVIALLCTKPRKGR